MPCTADQFCVLGQAGNVGAHDQRVFPVGLSVHKLLGLGSGLRQCALAAGNAGQLCLHLLLAVLHAGVLTVQLVQLRARLVLELLHDIMGWRARPA